jgi:two-component system response regulator YesN
MVQDKEKSRSLSNLIRSESNIDFFVSRYHEILNSKKIGFESTVLTAVIDDKIPCSIEDFTLLLEKNCNFHEPYFSCNVIKFSFSNLFYEKMDETMQEAVCQALSLLINEFTKKMCGSYTFELGEGVFINILNMKAQDCQTTIVSIFRELIKVFDYDNVYYTVSIGLGQIKEGSNGILESFDDAMTAMEYQCDNSDRLGIASDMKISHTINYSPATEKKIFALFEKGDLDSLRNAINDIISEHKTNNLSWRYMHILIKRIYYSTSFQQDNDPELFDKPQINCTLEEKISMLLSGYDKALYANGSECEENGLISIILQYIENHYSEDIYLQKLADKVGYSYKYMSRSFKEYTGYNISDYINFTRIKRAKELLETSNMNIQEIQNEVGIPSRTTFNRLFKKFEGIPPSTYRQLKAHRKILDIAEEQKDV